MYIEETADECKSQPRNEKKASIELDLAQLGEEQTKVAHHLARKAGDTISRL